MEVGFAGLGIMGSRMAANLRDAGHDVTVWNRTRAKADAFGGPVADSPRELARACDVLITMLVDGGQVESVLHDAVGGARPGALFVDMSTIAPRQARALGEALGKRDVRFLDAPVTGSSPKAEDGTLTIMAGGAAEDFERARPLFELMGEQVLHVGPVGHGQAIKLINNAVAAANTSTVAQALIAGAAAGVDLDALTRVMASGSGGSAVLDLKAGPMRAHDHTTLFKLEHMLKDVQLCLAEARASGGTFPFAGLAAELYGAGVGRGLGEQDFAAVLEVVEGLAGARL